MLNSIAMAAKKTQTKADFVRAHASLSPKEMVAKAKTDGLKLDASYVYNVRAYDKASKSKSKSTKGAATTTGARTAPSIKRPITTTSKAEELLRAVAAEIGLGRAVEILESERARVRKALGG